jgi:hypothetical protein
MPKISSWRATKRSAEMRSRYRGRATIRWSSHLANGCVPAEPIARPRAAAVSRTFLRSERSWSPASSTSPHGFVAISSTDSMSSGLISPSSRSTFAAPASSSRDSIALTSA